MKTRDPVIIIGVSLLSDNCFERALLLSAKMGSSGSSGCLSQELG